MSGLLDMESWRRSWGPALRVFGYICASFTILFIVLVVPTYYLTLIGLPEAFYQIAGMLFIIGFLFSIPLSFFKVMDEQAPGEIPLQMSK
ncbi:MAG: hypothetical protein ACW98K_03120 [Candidatus Kariarchaeaceae archaeon]|jgi:hypothetical protein